MYFGEYGGYSVLIMKMLGPTLPELMQLTGKNKVSKKTVLKIAIQAVSQFSYHITFVMRKAEINSINISDRRNGIHPFSGSYCE